MNPPNWNVNFLTKCENRDRDFQTSEDASVWMKHRRSYYARLQ